MDVCVKLSLYAYMCARMCLLTRTIFSLFTNKIKFY